MIKYIIVLTLVFGIGCYGGGSYQSGAQRTNKYLANPAYNSTTGEVENVNAMWSRDGQRPNYMNYETGEVYVPAGPNSWMNYDGDIIQPY